MDTLLWIGSAVAAILVVAVTVALLYVVRRYRSERGVEPRQLLSGRGLQFRVGGLLTLFATLLFILGVVFTDNARESRATGEAGLASLKGEPLRIEATGQQWLWRYDYPNGAFSYYKAIPVFIKRTRSCFGIVIALAKGLHGIEATYAGFPDHALAPACKDYFRFPQPYQVEGVHNSMSGRSACRNHGIVWSAKPMTH